MINKITNNIHEGYFDVFHINGRLRCWPKQNDNSTFSTNKNMPGSNCKELSTFSLEEVDGISIILINAYLFSHQQIELMVDENSSEKDLSYQKELILTIRNVLSETTEYANSYGKDVIEKYKNI
jgi:hypothetical protein